jgi:hypothetical protein
MPRSDLKCIWNIRQRRYGRCQAIWRGVPSNTREAWCWHIPHDLLRLRTVATYGFAVPSPIAQAPSLSQRKFLAAAGSKSLKPTYSMLAHSSADSTGAASRRPGRMRGLMALVVAIWCGGVIAGMLSLWSYALVPGSPGRPAARWPVESGVPRNPGRPALVMFAHPKCPCTRASIRELEKLIAQSAPALDVVVAFAQPPGMDAAWVHSDLWSSAAAIPGVTVVRDIDGSEARRFGAATSGQVLIYDAGGCLIFHGGITPARGHEGDNIGRSAVLALTTGRAASNCSPVLGCPLMNYQRTTNGN